MKLNTEHAADLLFCLFALPLMILVFPVEEWAGWHASFVVTMVLWLYFLYFIHREYTAALLTGGKKKFAYALVLLFLVTAVTFLMSLREVSFPNEIRTESPSRLYEHQQALWVLYIGVTAYSLAVGVLSQKIRRIEGERREEEHEADTRSAIESRAAQAVAGESITVTAGYKDVTVPLAGIQFIESRNNYACIHLDHQEDIVTQTTLKSLLEQLPDGKFIRIHRSYIVPVHRIEAKRATSVKLIGIDTPLPVGRAHKENLK